MKSIREILVATSIALDNIEAQQAAIETWEAVGFNVLSVNFSHEISNLSHLFPNIEFEAIDEFEQAEGARKLIPINAILNALKKRNANICGIINSDIHFRVDSSFLEKIYTTASDCCVIGARVDIKNLSEKYGTMYPYGYDYIFQDINMLSYYPTSPFKLGAPWWDMWMPMELILSGQIPKFLQDPVAFHLHHEKRWNMSEWSVYANHFIESLAKYEAWTTFCNKTNITSLGVESNEFGQQIPSLKKSKIETQSLDLVDVINMVIPRFIESKSEKITFV